ncbi:MAG: hypothetical protein ACXWYC_09290 [Actinomycetota bacterium]
MPGLTNTGMSGKIGPVRRLPLLVTVLALALAACGSDGGSPPDASSTDQATQVTAQMATSDVYVGAPQRVSVGLILGDNRLVSFGSVDLAFSYVGTAADPSEPQAGPSAVAVYVPTPGTPAGSGGAVATLPSEARGVYQAEDVTFDRAGFWQLDVTADIEGLGVRRSRATFPVLDDPAYPAPGEPALETENLTVDSTDAPVAAIDSRAVNEGDVPDPELHEWTIARAIEERRPALVVFATPVFCASQFCGPVTDVVAGLADRYADRAVFIHVEIWRDFEGRVLNEAAADWLFRDENLTEPWLYLIGADGTIVDRWATLFREDEVAARLEALPPMKGNA